MFKFTLEDKVLYLQYIQLLLLLVTQVNLYMQHVVFAFTDNYVQPSYVCHNTTHLLMQTYIKSLAKYKNKKSAHH